MPSEKAPGPDGFIGLFYKKCWTIIKDDLTQAIWSFYSHRTARLNLINEVNIVLLPKNQMAATISEYRPISLINSVAKIITKLLANRLAPHLNGMVSSAQNAFIKKRCIHDNFIYSQRFIQLLHRKRKPSLFIKLDISKAFDSISWPFLLEVMQVLGFSTKWRDWVAALLGTASSKVIVNGQQTSGIKHARGLRQGDPLSPMLFILAIDPLQRIIEKAASQGVLQPVLPKASQLRCSLYADDAAIFAVPSSTELERLHRILSFFGECSGLKINIAKTEIFPIRIQDSSVSQLLQNFPGKVCKFPGKYLGLPLHIRKLRRIEVHPLIDKIGARLPGWKGKLLTTAGRETLVKTVLSSQPIYHMTAFPEHKWLIRKIDRLRRSFLWRGETPENVYGGHSLVNWPTTCRPKTMGGLGILDLERFARALRLRWLWFKWKHKERAWNKLDLPCDNRDQELFASSTVVTIGDGKTASFWYSSWLDGRTPKSLAPSLFRKAKRKKISVYNGLKENKWISRILPIQTPQEIHEYVELFEQIQMITRDHNSEDSIRWRWTADGEYSTQSAYLIQFEGSYTKRKITPIWQAKAEPKCRFFVWTLLHNKVLTTNNLIKRNWPNDPICKLCSTEPETPNHICLNCTFAKQVWAYLVGWLNLTVIQAIPMTGSIYKYWKKCRAKVDKRQRRKFDGFMIYFLWNLWKERNRRIFQHTSLQPIQVAMKCKDEITQFTIANRVHEQEE